MKIVCISDTHTQHHRLDMPEGDLLIHAGDITNRGSIVDAIKLNKWLGTLPYKHKVVIAGNHDFCFEDYYNASVQEMTNCIYLHDSQVTIDKYVIWGSPYTPTFSNWSNMRDRGPEIRRHWNMIPDNTNILVTHGPPYGILDLTDTNEHAGCEDLKDIVMRIKPFLHVFGHIHEGYGQLEYKGITFVNASSVNSRYQPVNPPIVIEV